jgi:carbon storage regulator
MLYLVRKASQAIIVNNNIKIEVVEINRNSVKLGIEFPESVTVLRKEIYDKIAQENMEALNSFIPPKEQ